MGNNGEDDKKAQAQKQEERVAIEEYYGGDRLTKQARDADKLRYAVLTPSMFDDYEIIARLERTPAYNRPTNFNETLKKLSEATVMPESKPEPRNGYRPDSSSSSGSSGENVITF